MKPTETNESRDDFKLLDGEENLSDDDLDTAYQSKQHHTNRFPYHS